MRKLPLSPRLMLLLLMLPAVVGCVQSPPIFAPPPACSSLLPADWASPVADAPAPGFGSAALDLLKAWIGYGVGETGQLAKANGRTRDAIGIVARCESRDAAAVHQVARHKFLGLI